MSLRKLSVFACLVVLLGSVMSQAQAAQKPDLVVRIVNVQKIMALSTAVKGLKKARDSYSAKYDAEFAKKEKELQNSERELVKQKTLLSNEAYRKNVLAFRKDVAKFQKELKQRQQQLNAAYMYGLSKVSKQIKKIWLDVAEKEKASLVLRSSDVLMFSPDYDVTDQVVVLLNKALPQVAYPDPQKIGPAGKPKK